jgi:hypothetical protein
MELKNLRFRSRGTSVLLRAAICLAIAGAIWLCGGCKARKQAPEEGSTTSQNGGSPAGNGGPPNDVGFPNVGDSGRDAESVKSDLDSSLSPCQLEPGHNCKVTVFFATDRKPSGSRVFTECFSGERNEAAAPLTFGTVVVSIPAEHRVGHLKAHSHSLGRTLSVMWQFLIFK